MSASFRTIAERGVGGVPQPPPPGVRIRTTSPAASSTVHLVGEGARRGFVAAGEQPVLARARPGRRRRDPTVAVARRSVISETVDGFEHLELALDAVAAAELRRRHRCPSRSA